MLSRCVVVKGQQQMTLGAYIQVRGPYNNFFIYIFIGYAAVSVFVGVVNPFQQKDLVYALYCGMESSSISS